MFCNDIRCVWHRYFLIGWHWLEYHLCFATIFGVYRIDIAFFFLVLSVRVGYTKAGRPGDVSGYPRAWNRLVS